MTNELRIILGFLIAPLVTPLVFLMWAVLRTGTFDPQSWPAFYLIGAFAYIAAVWLGVPAFLLYSKLKLHNVFWFLIGGALIGLVVVVLLRMWLGSGTVKSEVVILVAASLSATVFRLIIGRHAYSRTRITR